MSEQNPPVMENPVPEAGRYTHSIGYRRNRTDLKTLGLTAVTLLFCVTLFCWVTGTRFGDYSAIRGPRKQPFTAVCKCRDGRPKAGGCEYYWGDEESRDNR